MILQTQYLTMQYMNNIRSQADHIKSLLKIDNENFIGIFLYGSQNYGLNYEGSDTDSILIVKSAEKPRREVKLTTGKVKIFTLGYFIDRLKQGDLECYEILYTKFNSINSKYSKYFSEFVSEFSKYINYNRIRNSLRKKLDEHLCYIRWLITNPEKARYNKKRLYWSIRVCNQLQQIDSGQDFESSLIYKETLGYDLIKIKTITNYLSPMEFSEICKYLVKFLKSLPRYANEVLDKEEECLSELYKNIMMIE